MAKHNNINFYFILFNLNLKLANPKELDLGLRILDSGILDSGTLDSGTLDSGILVVKITSSIRSLINLMDLGHNLMGHSSRSLKVHFGSQVTDIEFAIIPIPVKYYSGEQHCLAAITFKFLQLAFL